MFELTFPVFDDLQEKGIPNKRKSILHRQQRLYKLRQLQKICYYSTKTGGQSLRKGGVGGWVFRDIIRYIAKVLKISSSEDPYVLKTPKNVLAYMNCIYHVKIITKKFCKCYNIKVYFLLADKMIPSHTICLLQNFTV